MEQLFELRKGVNPICLRPYPVPKVHEKMFKKEVERSFLLLVLEIKNDSEWGDTSFVQSKPKSNQVCFLSYFRNLNKKLKRKRSIPKINEMLLKL